MADSVPIAWQRDCSPDTDDSHQMKNGIISFIYNTALVALMVNIAASAI